MGKSSSTQELKRITAALNQFPDGATPAELLRETGLSIAERTMARRLDNLIARGDVIVRGKARATRYFLVGRPPGPNDTSNAETNEINIVTLSKKGRSILEKVTQPEAKRLPVSYRREFLENYEPNVTQYFSAADKRRLRETGRTPQPDYPAGTYAKQIMNRLLIDLSWNSSRLEGNTYSLLDTERLIGAGVAADNKSALDAQMILNHKDAIEFIVNSAADIEFNRYNILSLHALLSNNLLPDPSASGRLRRQPVGIAKSVYTPLAIPQLIEEVFELILDKARQIDDPFEQSFFVMVHLPYLQPFDDVNKRVSRLAANIPLVKHNLAPLSFIDVPKDMYVNGTLGIYELNRVELLKDIYLWTYERSALRYAVIRQSIGEPDPIKLKYRQELRSVIGEIVKNAPGAKAASEYIATFLERIETGDRLKFSEAVQTELLALHDGNLARYYISPGEFERWKAKQ